MMTAISISQSFVTCEVQELGEEGPAGGLALDAGLGHAGSLQHHVPVFLIDTLCALPQCLTHLC